LRPLLLTQIDGFVVNRSRVEIGVASRVEMHALEQQPAKSAFSSSTSSDAAEFCSQHILGWRQR